LSVLEPSVEVEPTTPNLGDPKDDSLWLAILRYLGLV